MASNDAASSIVVIPRRSTRLTVSFTADATVQDSPDSPTVVVLANRDNRRRASERSPFVNGTTPPRKRPAINWPGTPFPFPQTLSLLSTPTPHDSIIPDTPALSETDSTSVLSDSLSDPSYFPTDDLNASTDRARVLFGDVSDEEFSDDLSGCATIRITTSSPSIVLISPPPPFPRAHRGFVPSKTPKLDVLFELYHVLEADRQLVREMMTADTPNADLLTPLIAFGPHGGYNARQAVRLWIAGLIDFRSFFKGR
jgi:hypothetical protein